LLQAHTEFTIVGECANGRQAVTAMSELSPDLVFLDVQMPELGGFEVLNQFDPKHLPVVVFVTAFDTFALKAFEAHALDYLLKPVADDRFFEALGRAKIYLAGREAGQFRDRLLGLMREVSHPARHLSRLAVESGGRLVFLKVSDVDWIEAAGNYLK